MEEVGRIAIGDFQKQPDGSWHCIKNSDVGTKTDKIIRLQPGMVFRKGTTFCGLDIAAALDGISETQEKSNA